MKMAVTTPTNALYDSNLDGPTFGDGHDLMIYDASNTNTNSYMNSKSYTFPNGLAGSAGGDWLLGSQLFQVAEIEVFAVGKMDSAILDFTKQTNLLSLIGKLP